MLDVLILTYNHEDYIAECIQSVLSQITSFEVNILIYDDQSNDKTQDIILQYQQEYPDRIKYIISNKNAGQFEGAHQLFLNTKTKYFAILEGDDFWINDYKLDAQVKFLENNEDFSACFHDVKIKVENNIKDAIEKEKSKAFYKTYSQLNKYTSVVYPHHLINRLIIPTSSLVIRKCAVPADEILQYKGNFNHSLNWVIQLYTIKNSKFKYFNEAWGVYRDHKDGVTKYSSYDSFKKPILKVLKTLLKDPYYKNLKSNIYSTLAIELNYLISNSKKMTILEKRVMSFSIIRYSFLASIHKVMDINNALNK